MPDRKVVRLKAWDYSTQAYYFATICSHEKRCIFGKIKNGRSLLSEVGRIVEEEWLKSANMRPHIALEEFVVMPNHLHGIVVLTKSGPGLPAAESASEIGYLRRKGKVRREPQSLSSFIAGFKAAVTKRINELNPQVKHAVWQRGFYEHVIRSEKDLYLIKQYILDNPANWESDEEFRQH